MNHLDIFRTRLRDAIFGRTKIRVVSLKDSDDIVPFFIIGTFRSGTTLFRYLLDTHTQICCPPETKFLVNFSGIKEHKATVESLESMGLEEEYIKQKLRDLSSSFYQPYLASKDKSILVDKTPEYVRILDFIDWLYDGKCKYILIFRNGLDVANSMSEQNIEPLEGNNNINTAFEYWRHDTEIMLDWLEKKNDSCHKVVYDDLCANVEGVISGVLQFMGLDWEQEILEWYSQDHDRGYEDIKARRQRGIKKSSANYENWDVQTIERFKELSCELHKKIGFDPDTLKYL